MTGIFDLELFGEPGDILPVITRFNTVIKTNYGFKWIDDATWDNWKFCIIFPDHQKAKYFLEHFKWEMREFQEGMLKDDYVFHIVHFKYPQEKRLYADQMRMSHDYVCDL